MGKSVKKVADKDGDGYKCGGKVKGYAKGGSVRAKVPSTQGNDQKKSNLTVQEGKGKLRGMGKATRGGKFSGCY